MNRVMTRRTGKCLCGGVGFRADTDDTIQACHCVQCQRWTGGGPLFTVRATNIEVTGEANTASYFASEWGERVFCKVCGSTLWWKMKDKPTAGVVAGLLDDQSGLTVAEEIFVDHRPGWLPPFDGATQSTEAEEMAKLDAYLQEQGG